MERYDRQIALSEIGIAGQQKLADAKVLVVGAGGLGCAVLQNLAAAGVGHIGIVDGDGIEESNLHRQFLYLQEDCGLLKAEVAKTAISKQNPYAEVVAFTHFFTEENAFDVVGDYQIVVDCTDTVPARYLINDVALVKKIPMVYASVHKFEGQLSVFNYEAGPTYRCLFPEKESVQVNCNEAGVLGVIPNMLGTLQAAEVMKIILGIGKVLSGKLLLFDGLQHHTQKISVEKNPVEIQHGLLNGIAILNRTKNDIKSIDALTFIEVAKNADTLIIDLREAYEEPKLNFPNLRNIPLDQLENYLENHSKTQNIVLFCQFGNKSAEAGRYLLKRGYQNIVHLDKGLETLLKTHPLHV